MAIPIIRLVLCIAVGWACIATALWLGAKSQLERTDVPQPYRRLVPLWPFRAWLDERIRHRTWSNYTKHGRRLLLLQNVLVIIGAALGGSVVWFMVGLRR